MPPATFDAVMNTLAVYATGRTMQLPGIARHLKIDPALDRIELNFGGNPWRLQTQRGGEQGFDGNTHRGLVNSKMAVSDMLLTF